MCDGADDTPSEDCLNRMSEGAAEFELRFIDTAPPPITQEENAKGKVKDLYYLLNTDAFENVRNSLLADARKSVESDPQRQKIDEKIFPQIRELLANKVSSLVADPALRKKLTDKILAIKFKGQDCSKYSPNKESISAVLVSNALYEPLNNSFRYCLGFNSSGTSEFSLAFIIAHELSHSIDPCGLTVGPSDFTFQYSANTTRQRAEKQFPIGGAIACLRSRASVNAQRMGADPTGPGSAASSFQQPNYASPSPIGYQYQYPQQPFSSFCDRDQITESFADWMALELTPAYIQKNHPNLTLDQRRVGYSNMFRPLCKEQTTNGFDEHPETSLRANALALVQPQIRKQMECARPAPTYTYCSAEGNRGTRPQPNNVNPNAYGAPNTYLWPGGYGTVPNALPSDAEDPDAAPAQQEAPIPSYNGRMQK